MIVKLLSEHHLEAAEARPSLHLSKCQIVGNLMLRLKFILQAQQQEESDDETAPGSTLFVKNLNFSTTDESLREVGNWRWRLVSCRSHKSNKQTI